VVQTELEINLAIVDLHWVHDYVRFLEQSIDAKLKNIEESIQKSRDERYTEKLIDDHQMVGLHFHQNVSFTSFILVHSHLERSISKIAASIANDYPTVLNPSDLAGEDSIDKNKNYFKKVIGLDLSATPRDKIR